MRFSVWLVSGYAHVFALLPVVFLLYPLHDWDTGAWVACSTRQRSGRV